MEVKTLFCNYKGDCISKFTGFECETCPHFKRTGENIKEIRERQSAMWEDVDKSLEE